MKIRNKLLASLAGFVLSLLPCLAQPAAVDNRFSCAISGISVRALVTLPDDTVLAGGNFTNVNGAAKTNLVRLAGDGSTAGHVPDADGTVEVLAMAGDGKILLGGSFRTVGGTPRNGIARLHSDGSLDSAFAPAMAGTNSVVTSLAAQGDGKVLVGGYPSVFRLNADGTLDAGFTAPSNMSPIFALTVQLDGRILLGTAHRDNAVHRLNADGSIDRSFSRPSFLVSPPFYSSAWIRKIALDDAGNILILGSFLQVNGVGRGNLARLHSDGTLDTSFSPGAAGLLSEMKIQADGKILVGGSFSNFDGQPRSRLARLHADGSLDIGFDSSNGADASVMSISLQGGGGIFVGGNFSSYAGTTNSLLVRLPGGNIPETAPALIRQPAHLIVNEGANATFAALASGFPLSYQWQFNGTDLLGATNSHLFIARAISPNAGSYTVQISNSLGSIASSPAELNVNRYVQGSPMRTLATVSGGDIISLALGLDESVFLAGNFTSLIGTSGGRRIKKVFMNGQIDYTSSTWNGVDCCSVNALAVQPDGKVLIAGDFRTVGVYAPGDRSFYGLARYNQDGSVDLSFDASSSVWAEPFQAIAVQSDGKILVGGLGLRTALGDSGLARLHEDGRLDSTFRATDAAHFSVNCIVLNRERIFLGGFTNYLNPRGRNLLCLNRNGRLDESFDSGTGPNDLVFAVRVQRDDKVIIAGKFTAVNGTARTRVARLHADGSLDAGFNPGSGPNTNVYHLALQEDGKILISGAFTSVAGTAVPGIARLLPDGNFDSTFIPLSGAGGGPVLIEPGGNVVVANRSQVSVLHGDLETAREPGRLKLALPSTESVIVAFKGEFGRSYNLQRSPNLADWTSVTNFLMGDTDLQFQILRTGPAGYFRVFGVGPR